MNIKKNDDSIRWAFIKPRYHGRKINGMKDRLKQAMASGQNREAQVFKYDKYVWGCGHLEPPCLMHHYENAAKKNEEVSDVNWNGK